MKQRKIPSYRLHKPSGRAVVTINKREVPLGKHGTPESRAAYDAVIARWLAGGRIDGPPAGTVGNLCRRYVAHAKSYYVKRGDTTSSYVRAKLVCRTLDLWHGKEPAAMFGPRKLDVLRNHWMSQGLVRNTVNLYAKIVVDILAWGVSQEIAPVETWQALTTMRPLAEGRTAAKEGKPVRPVAIERIKATIDAAPPKVADQIQLQLLTGMRSGEMLSMRPCDLDRSGDVWFYTPPMFKSEHKVAHRRIGLGPEAQTILSRWLDGPDDVFIFHRRVHSPRNARSVKPSVIRIQVTNYYDAVERICLKLDPCPALPDAHIDRVRAKLTPDQKRVLREHLRKVRWTPHQLRHTAATLLRAAKDLESARIALGHSGVAMTKRYAEQSDESWKAEIAPGAVALDRAVSSLLPRHTQEPNQGKDDRRIESLRETPVGQFKAKTVTPSSNSTRNKTPPAQLDTNERVQYSPCARRASKLEGTLRQQKDGERLTVGSRISMLTDKRKIPRYDHVPGSNDAFVTINDREIYLGAYDSDESRQRYDELINKHFQMPLARKKANFTVSVLCVHYREHVLSKEGAESADHEVAIRVCDELCRRLGNRKTTSLRFRHFDEMRRDWAKANLDVPTIERYADSVIDLFRWGVDEHLTTQNTLDRLLVLRQLKPGQG